MCYRENVFYVVLCDRCGQAAPEGTGWWTPSLADRAATGAGWEITRTEHACPQCVASDRKPPLGSELKPGLAGEADDGPSSSSRLDVCWPPSRSSTSQRAPR